MVDRAVRVVRGSLPCFYLTSTVAHTFPGCALSCLALPLIVVVITAQLSSHPIPSLPSRVAGWQTALGPVSGEHGMVRQSQSREMR